MPDRFKKSRPKREEIDEAKKRILDSLACFYGAFKDKPGRVLRETLTADVTGSASLWGTSRHVPPEMAAWANGTCVRTLDFNDTYLSKEPCHPSDLIASLWAACEVSGNKRQGRLLLGAIVLGYDVLCRLCDANSIRVRGWDHVTYLPIASAVACSYILGLTPEQTRNAIALSVVGNNALRQTRVGTISDWKASCAAYAARAGLSAARLAQQGFTGPTDIFEGRNGFFRQVSGPFKLPARSGGILSTHTKFFPAEHHAQSAIEAAISLRRGLHHPSIRSIQIDAFSVAVEIIGSEKEKWRPTTRETADHSLPYLVAAALSDGDITLEQYENKRFLDADIRKLMSRVRVKAVPEYSKMYPSKMPTRVIVKLRNGMNYSREVVSPMGYAGRPMSWGQVEDKFTRLATKRMGPAKRSALVRALADFESVDRLSSLNSKMEVDR